MQSTLNAIIKRIAVLCVRVYARTVSVDWFHLTAPKLMRGRLCPRNCLLISTKGVGTLSTEFGSALTTCWRGVYMYGTVATSTP